MPGGKSNLIHTKCTHTRSHMVGDFSSFCVFVFARVVQNRMGAGVRMPMPCGVASQYPFFFFFY
uniref:Uncharacterized protein n=1 Tax=Cyprinodon variegatus TaxID=28743 RepID=A0A3Q2EAF1_CYPVA